MSYSERSAALLMDIIVHIETELCKHGIDAQKSEEIARLTCDKLRHDFGGVNFYFPKGRELDVMMKHHKICQRFNGHNHSELANEFDTSIQNIYRILKVAYEKERDEKQPQLF